jgi:sulfoxide reductase heme-binding subunit YedZ
VSFNELLLSRWTKPLFFALGLMPLGTLVWAILVDQLGANPAETLVRSTGDWSLRLLCVVLTLTPLRSVLGWAALARLRRMVGLFAYFYVTLHLLSYAWFDMGFELGDIARDIAKRPFILVGFLALVLLSAMAFTSFNLAIKTLGGKAWKRLHQSVYLVALLAILHFFWMRAGKNDFAEVMVYAGVMAVLLGWRVRHAMLSRRQVHC